MAVKKKLKTRFIQIENPNLITDEGEPLRAKVVDTTLDMWSRKGWRKVESAAEFIVDDDTVTVVAPGETPEGVTTDEKDPSLTEGDGGQGAPEETPEELAAREAAQADAQREAEAEAQRLAEAQQPNTASRLGRRS